MDENHNIKAAYLERKKMYGFRRYIIILYEITIVLCLVIIGQKLIVRENIGDSSTFSSAILFLILFAIGLPALKRYLTYSYLCCPGIGKILSKKEIDLLLQHERFCNVRNLGDIGDNFMESAHWWYLNGILVPKKIVISCESDAPTAPYISGYFATILLIGLSTGEKARVKVSSNRSDVLAYIQAYIVSQHNMLSGRELIDVKGDKKKEMIKKIILSE